MPDGSITFTSDEVTSPLVSILVPVYNVEPYLQSALASIANQSHRNVEVIVIDDGSTDASHLIATNFARDDSRFKVYRNDQNVRIVASLNRALSEARGSYIARCDGDDLMEPDRIRRQLEHLQQHPQIGLVGCSFRTIDEEGRHLRDVNYPIGPDLISQLLPYYSPVSHIWLARREVYDRVGPYRLASVEDYDFLLRAHLHGYKLDNLDYFGMRIRIRSGNTVGRYGLTQRRLANFARKVHQEERQGNFNFYSLEKEVAIIRSSSKGILKRLHYLSDQLSNSASLSTSRLIRLGLHGAAAVCSPYKLQYYYLMLRAAVIRHHWRRQT